MDEKLHQKIFEDNLALIDTPLIGRASNSIHYPGTSNVYSIHIPPDVLTYPFNISEFHHRHMNAAAAAAGAATAAAAASLGGAGSDTSGSADNTDVGNHHHHLPHHYSGNAPSSGVYYQSMCPSPSFHLTQFPCTDIFPISFSAIFSCFPRKEQEPPQIH